MNAKQIDEYEMRIVIGMLNDLDTFGIDGEFADECRVLGKDIVKNAHNVIDIARIYAQYKDIKVRFNKKWKLANE